MTKEKKYLLRIDLPCPKCDKHLVEEFTLNTKLNSVESSEVFSCESGCGIMPKKEYIGEKTPPEKIPPEFLKSFFEN